MGFYWDDGVSGITFEREGFQKRIAEGEAGNVDTVIVKDMGRFGRNYLKVGFYTEMLFPENAYAAEHCPENNHSHGYASPYEWSCTAISYILEKQEYMGHTILGKTLTDNFKTKKCRKAKPEELMIFKNTHDAIIDEETWNNAQRLKRTWIYTL